MGAMLLQHLSQDNAGKAGINIQASAGVEGQHTLNVILEASDSQKVQEFMAPFAQMVCPAAFDSLEIVRPGIPPNPSALRPGVTSGPVVGGTWDPYIDHSVFMPGAIIDVLGR